MRRAPGANDPEQHDAAPCAHGNEDQQASEPNQFTATRVVDGAKPDESMADLIQHEAQSSPTSKDQPYQGEEFYHDTLSGQVSSFHQNEAGFDK